MGDLKKSYEDEYARLNLRFDRALIEHKLALQYFEFRSFYLVFLPLTTIATLITIIGFLLSGTTQKDDGNGVETDPLLTGQFVARVSYSGMVVDEPLALEKAVQSYESNLVLSSTSTSHLSFMPTRRVHNKLHSCGRISH